MSKEVKRKKYDIDNSLNGAHTHAERERFKKLNQIWGFKKCKN